MPQPRAQPRAAARRACACAAALVALCLPVAARAAVHPQIRVGVFPTGIALDPESGTVYVADGTTGTLSLIDGDTCNARERSGCGQRPGTIGAGLDPVGAAVDEATHTLYVVDSLADRVAVVNGATCDARVRSGCGRAPATVRVGVEPQFLAVDERTDTVYVANVLSDTVSVIDGRSCNAETAAGCGAPRASIPVGPGPFALAIDDRTGSLYVADLLADTVSVVDISRCDAAITTGCRGRVLSVEVGATPGGIALDADTDTLYVTGQASDDVALIDAATCNARRTSGCRRRPAEVRAGAGARGVAVDEATDTVYVANTAANTVSVIDGATCNASVRSGCARPAAVAPVGVSPRRLAIDAQTDTIYVTNAGSDTVTMLDGATCNGAVRRGCAAAPAGAGGGGSARGAAPTATPSVLRAGPER